MDAWNRMEQFSGTCSTVPSIVPAGKRRIRQSVIGADMRRPPSSGDRFVPSETLPITDGRRR
ncbi:hypothetical protein [Azospirillum largimobile]